MGSENKKPWWKPSPTTRLKGKAFLAKFRDGASVAADVARSINTLRGKPTLKNYVALFSIGLDAFLDRDTGIVYDKSYQNIRLGQSSGAVMNSLRGLPGTTTHRGADHTYQITPDLYGESIVFSQWSDGRPDRFSCYYVGDDSRETKERVFRALGRAVWEKYGPRVKISFPENKPSEYHAWSLGDPPTCDQTESILRRLRGYLAKNHRRGVILYGDPGVGKSTMARRIAQDLGMHTFYANGDELIKLESSEVQMLLRMLRPEVVILDDVDRLKASRLKTLVDEIRPWVPLLIVTMNDRKAVGPAVKRPGRFDWHIEVERIVSVRHIVPQLPEQYVEELSAWPAAWLEEVRVRIDTEGLEDIEVWLDELRELVKTNTVNLVDNKEGGEVGGA